MNRVAPWHQTNWDWRAAGNFIGGGSGTGLLLFAALAAASGMAYRPMGLLGLALVGAGLFCVWMEIGKPWRAFNVVLHPQTSWMTRESLVAPFLFLGGLAAVVFGGGAAAWIAAVFGMGFLYCQGRILFASKGIPAWRQPRIVPLMIGTGLAEGAGLLAVLLPVLGSPTDLRWPFWLLLATLAVRAWLWRAYLNQLAAAGAPSKTLAVYAKFDNPFLHAANTLPGLLAVAAALGGGAWLGALGGLLAVGGGWALKFTIVARAAFNQGFAIPKVPVRGTGQPGPGSQPGWK